MTKLFLAIILSTIAAGQTVSSITFDGIGDSSARVIFNVSSTFTEYRVRYRTTDCTDGMGNYVQTNNTIASTLVLYAMSAQISGLAPSTLYHVCPEVRNGVGAWSTGVEATFTTLARTQVLPSPPVPVSMTFPAQSGATLTVPAGDCDNMTTGFQVRLNAAVPGDTIVIPAGTICSGNYTMPAAPETRTISAVVTSTSTITTSTAHGITDNQEIHFSTGGPNSNCLPGNIIFPGHTGLFFNCQKGGGWNFADKYCANFVDATHLQVMLEDCMTVARPGYIAFTADAGAETVSYLPTVRTPGGYQSAAAFGAGVAANTKIQFVSTGTLPAGLSVDTDYFLLTACTASSNAACTTQVSLMSGGSAVNITGAGTGTHYIVDQGSGTFYVAPAPTQGENWKLITTDGNLPPVGVRIDSSYDDQLAVIRKSDYTVNGTPSLDTGTFAHNWRIRGIKFDGLMNNDYLTTTDPRSACIGPYTRQDSRFIVFDQTRLAGPKEGSFNRLGCRGGALSMFWSGGYMSIINSDWRDITYWHPWFGDETNGIGAGAGMAPSVAGGGTIARFTAGVAHLGMTTVTTSSNADLTITGGTSSVDGKVYIDMMGVIQYLLPTGMTAGCSVTGTTCNVDTSQANPAWPEDGNMRMAGLRLFTIELTGGAIASYSYAQGGDPGLTRIGYTGTAPFATEGANFLVGGEGPGPYMMYNNYIGGAGLTTHFDDGGATWIDRHDYTIQQNTFDIPSYTLLLTSPDSDGLWYGNRQPLEWKSGQRILVTGNNFVGCYSQSNPNGLCVVMTNAAGGYTTDVEISNNQFTYVDGCIHYPSPTMSVVPAGIPPKRTLIKNNLCLVDAFNHYVPGDAQPRGFSLYGNNSSEDVTIDHNTVFNNLGNAGQFFYSNWSPIGGMTVTNNIYFAVNSGNMFTQENGFCNGLHNKAFTDVCFTSGPGNPSFTHENNVYAPSWVDPENMVGGILSDATVTGAFSGEFPPNLVPSGVGWNAKVTTINWLCGLTCTGNKPQLKLAPGSPYITASTDMTPIGIEDWTVFEQTLGRVNNVSVGSITGASAIVSLTAPSTFGCTVDYNTTGDFTDPYTRVANVGGSTAQSVDLTALSLNTEYFYRINCASEQPTGSFTTLDVAPPRFSGFISVTGGVTVQ